MIELQLPFPPSVNRIWRCVGGRNIKSREGRQYTDAAVFKIRQQMGRQKTLEGVLNVSLVFMCPDKRRRDVDNLLKASLDALTTAGVWKDDSQIHKLTASKVYAKDKGCVLVRITPYG